MFYSFHPGIVIFHISKLVDVTMKILDAYKFCPGPGGIKLLITILGNKFAYACHTSYNFKELIKFEEKKVDPDVI
jgi:hypothetical protein